jgi:AcrR family transcriptional regulator
MASNKQKIIDAASQCFVQKGFHATSMRDIARAAGVSLGNIYNHFDRKTALVFAIADAESESISEAASFFEDTSLPAVTAVLAFVDAYFKEEGSPDSAALMVEIAAESSRNKKVAQAFLTNRRKLVSALSTFLVRAQQKGEIAANLKPAQAGEIIIDIIEGTIARACLSGKKPGRAAKNEVHFMIEKYLGT